MTNKSEWIISPKMIIFNSFLTKKNPLFHGANNSIFDKKSQKESASPWGQFFGQKVWITFSMGPYRDHRSVPSSLELSRQPFFIDVLDIVHNLVWYFPLFWHWKFNSFLYWCCSLFWHWNDLSLLLMLTLIVNWQYWPSSRYWYCRVPPQCDPIVLQKKTFIELVEKTGFKSIQSQQKENFYWKENFIEKKSQQKENFY